MFLLLLKFGIGHHNLSTISTSLSHTIASPFLHHHFTLTSLPPSVPLPFYYQSTTIVLQPHNHTTISPPPHNHNTTPPSLPHKIWDLRRGELAYVMRGHRDSITGLSLSPDGSYVLSTSMDNTGYYFYCFVMVIIVFVIIIVFIFLLLLLFLLSFFY